MATNRQNLFSRLTKLFRAGPIVKRKVKGIHTGNIKSSALDVFRKSTATVYGNSLNAYGQYDRLSRYADFSEMEYCVSGDTKIAIPNGYMTIRDLAEKYGLDKEFVVYAYDHNQGKVVPALGKQARKTRTDHAWKVTFDTGKEIIGSSNHRLMKRDGTFCKIEDLGVGDSMMPFLRKDFYNNGKDEGNGYRWVWTVKEGYVTEHKLIAEWAAGRSLNLGECVHHINYIKWDNRPENLRIMTTGDHTTLHNNQDKRSPKNKEWIEKFKKQHSVWMKENNPAKRKDITFGRIIEICEDIGYNLYRLCESLDTDPNVIKRRLKENGYKDFIIFAKAYCPGWISDSWDNEGKNNPRFNHNLTFQKICDAYTPGKSLKKLSLELGVSVTPIMNRILEKGYSTYSDFKQEYRNHKIVSIEYYGEIDLYDLTVDGYKNFATDSIISHNTPEIASAVDIYADETVAKDEKGRSLHIYSENQKIKKLLDELFYDTLSFEFVSRSWVRNLCKYGDHMVMLDVAPGYGVINAYPIPVNEIEREEGFDPNNPFSVRFRWVTEGNQVLENWQIAHFRLLGNDSFLPYGSSVLEPARRIWRQLIMAEDAMLVYRVIRSPERRVFYIDVANAPPNDVPQLIENAKATLKSQEVVDSTTGRVDQRYNPWAVDIDYFIPVRGGETTTRVETLPGGTNATAIDDVEYIQRKLFAALKVPKPYLGFDEGLGSKANLAQEDIRFARSIQQIQQVVVAEMNKIAAIHLASHGFDGEDLIDFHLSLSNPSTMAQQQKLELLRTKLEILGTIPEGKLTDNWAYKEVMDMTDNDIERLEEDQVREILRKVKLEEMGAPESGEGGGLGGGGGGFGGGGGDLGGGLEGGDDFDFGDEGDDEGGDEEEGGEEEDLFADEGEADGDLMTNEEEVYELDLDEDIIEFDMSETEVGDYTPVSQQNQLSRYRHNNHRPSRTKDRGPKGLKTPNPGDPLHHEDEYFKDMMGKTTFRGSPFKLSDSVERTMRQIEDSEIKRTRFNRDVKQAIDSLPKNININKGLNKSQNNLIIESDEDDDITGDDE